MMSGFFRDGPGPFEQENDYFSLATPYDELGEQQRVEYTQFLFFRRNHAEKLLNLERRVLEKKQEAEEVRLRDRPEEAAAQLSKHLAQRAEMQARQDAFVHTLDVSAGYAARKLKELAGQYG